MKRAVLPLVLFAGLATLLFSCSKSTDDTSFSPTPSMIASITEDAWQATSIDAYFTKSNDTTNLVISGKETTSDRTIYLKLINFQNKAIDYSVDSPGVQAVAYYKKASVTYYGKLGVIKIYSVTPGLVKGTFDFSMKDQTGLKNMEVKGKFTAAPAQ